MGKRLFYTAMLLFCWSWVVAPALPAADFETIQAHLRQRLANGNGKVSVRIAGERLRAKRMIQQFYEQRAYQPAWSSPSGLSPQVDALIDSLHTLEHEGLDPHDYHLYALDALVGDVRHPETATDTAKLADLELLLSDAFLSAALHLKAGRLQPVKRGSQSHPLDLEMVRHLERALTKGTLTGMLHELVPADSAYTALRQALAQYRQIAAKGGWLPIPRGPAMKFGVHSERVAMLRARLQVTGDLTASVAPEETNPDF